MALRNSNINYIQWNTGSGEVIGTVKSVTTSSDGVTITVDATDFIKKEKKMKYDLKNVTSISIERSDDNGTVTATAYGRDPYCPSHVAVIKLASAKCNPDDIFDFNIGAKLAFDRLYEGYDMTPKPKRKPYNGKIFVEKYPGNALKSHKIYQVCNGCIQPATIDRDPYIFEDMDDAGMSWAIHTTIYDRYAPLSVFPSTMTKAYFVKE